jgi:Putative MetA-pathway of phenol degradation
MSPLGSQEHFRLSRRLLVMLLLLAAPALRAQGGPPFLTDDPGTPGNRHWEINVGLTSEHHSGDAEFAVPDFDINYGWGDRIQLNYETPVAVTKNGSDTEAGLGNSAVAVKWRFYQRMKAGQDDPQFAVSTYPRLVLENPTNAAQRGVVSRGPQFLLPMEFSGRIGWFAYDGEVGHWFNAYNPDQWLGGFLVGRELGKKAEAYTEIYTIQDSTGPARQRQSTIGFGGRYTLSEHLVLMGMWGRSFQAVSPGNGEANYVGYFGLQFLFGPKEKGPKEKVPPQAGSPEAGH